MPQAAPRALDREQLLAFVRAAEQVSVELAEETLELAARVWTQEHD